MSDFFKPIPSRDKVTERGGFLTEIWRRFFNEVFRDYETRIKDLETKSANHESRITTLEGP